MRTLQWLFVALFTIWIALWVRNFQWMADLYKSEGNNYLWIASVVFGYSIFLIFPATIGAVGYIERKKEERGK